MLQPVLAASLVPYLGRDGDAKGISDQELRRTLLVEHVDLGDLEARVR